MKSTVEKRASRKEPVKCVIANTPRYKVCTSGGSRGGARGAGAPPLAREKKIFYIVSCRYVATPGLAPWPPQLAISCVA